jgi:hypothetical protein
MWWHMRARPLVYLIILNMDHRWGVVARVMFVLRVENGLGEGSPGLYIYIYIYIYIHMKRLFTF